MAPRGRDRRRADRLCKGSQAVSDLVFVLLTVVLFAGLTVLVRAVEKL